jgi:hypothetical protein
VSSGRVYQPDQRRAAEILGSRNPSVLSARYRGRLGWRRKLDPRQLASCERQSPVFVWLTVNLKNPGVLLSRLKLKDGIEGNGRIDLGYGQHPRWAPYLELPTDLNRLLAQRTKRHHGMTV